MAAIIFPERCYHFLKARNGMFEPWRWSLIDGRDVPRNVIIVNEDAPKSITLDLSVQTFAVGSPSPFGSGEHWVRVINRGDPITFHSDEDDAPAIFPYVLLKDKAIHIRERSAIIIYLSTVSLRVTTYSSLSITST